MSFLLGDLNDNESPKSIWWGARKRERKKKGAMDYDYRLTPGRGGGKMPGRENEMRRREISISHPAKKSPIMVSLYSRHHRHLMMESVDA